MISLGSINLDLQLRVDRWPSSGETVVCSDFVVLGGGKAANVAAAATKLGSVSLLLGRVGRDPLSDRALMTLRAIGVHTEGVRFTSDALTGIAMIFVRPDGEKTIVLAENANQHWSHAEIGSLVGEIDRCSQQSILVIDAEISNEALHAAVVAAKRTGMRILLDPSPAQRVDDDLLARVDFVTPNAAEAQQLTNRAIESDDDALLAADTLLDKGVKSAFVKLSRGGVAAVSSASRMLITAPPVAVVDKTGAGDAFTGALAVALADGHELERAARFACAAAAHAVTGFGCQPSYGTRDEIEQLEREVRVERRSRRWAS